MDHQTTENSNQVPSPQGNSSKIWMIVAIVLLIIWLVTCIFGYYKWKAYQKKVGDLGAQINSQKLQITDLQSQIGVIQGSKTVVVVQTDEQQIRTASINFGEATVGAVNDKTFQLAEIKIFGNDKNFASVSVGDIKSGVGGFTMILKKVNNTWTVIYDGQNLLPEDQKRFGIPNDY